MSSRRIEIIGAGPAGSSAAIAALQHGAAVTIFEKSRFPRHKVCGEFLSPEARLVMQRLGVWDQFVALKPAPLREIELQIGNTRKRWTLPEAAYGISRYALDELLLTHAVSMGARVVRELKSIPGISDRLPTRPSVPLSFTEANSACEIGSSPTVIAHGRKNPSSRGQRLFGFKAHFEGPPSDLCSLFFERACYAGVSQIETGAINVCGLAPEETLAAHGFDVDAFLQAWPAMRACLAPMRRSMDWLTTGPLVFGKPGMGEKGYSAAVSSKIYPAGDAFGFVDPFTGSGMLAAMATGTIAGVSAASGRSLAEHLTECQKLLGLQYGMAGIVRNALRFGAGEFFVSIIPGQWLFEWTRPRLHFAGA